jgi:serine/threonine-protein kinase SRPK3
VATRPSGLLGTFIGTCLLNTNLDDIEVLWNSFKDRYAILKICTTDVNRTDQAHHELRLSRHIAAAKPGHLGLKYIRTVNDSFEIQGPKGPHMCLVYEPMREPLWMLQRRMSDGIYSFGLLGYTVKFLLIGLSYLHNECGVIHTGGLSFRCSTTLTISPSDLKRENVLVGLEKSLSLDDIVGDEIKSPSPRKILPDCTIYMSRNDFGHPKSTPGRPKISDFDTAVQVTSSQKTFSHPIQPNCYRAPEVILGAPWSYPVDIWNLGAMVHILSSPYFLVLNDLMNQALGSLGRESSI